MKKKSYLPINCWVKYQIHPQSFHMRAFPPWKFLWEQLSPWSLYFGAMSPFPLTWQPHVLLFFHIIINVGPKIIFSLPPSPLSPTTSYPPLLPPDNLFPKNKPNFQQQHLPPPFTYTQKNNKPYTTVAAIQIRRRLAQTMWQIYKK